jgi:hypothetical protein
MKSVTGPTRVSGLTYVNALIGPNNEGKSTLLDAVNLCRYVATPIGETDAAAAYMIERLVHRDLDAILSIDLYFEFDESDASRLGMITRDFDRSEYLRYTVRWSGQAEAVEPIYMYPDSVALKLKGVDPFDVGLCQITNVFTLTASPDPISQWIIPNRRPNPEVTHSGGNPNVYAAAGGPGPNGYAVFSLFFEWVTRIIYVPSYRPLETDSDTSELLKWLLRMLTTKNAQFGDFQKLITRLIPSVRYLYPTTEPNLRVSSTEMADATQAFTLDHVGGGVNELLRLARVIWQAEPGSVILIEEPERGVHPRSQREFAAAVLEHASDQGKQIIWATHSTVLAPVWDGTSANFVRFDADGSTISAVLDPEDSDDLRTRLGVSPADLYGYALLLMVDGPSEVVLFPRLLENRLGAQAASAIRVSPIDGSVASRTDRIISVDRALRNSGTGLYILTDRDEGWEKAVKRIQADSDGDGPRIKIWDCGLAGSVRRPEFEDNFCVEELVQAANQVASSDLLTVDALTERLSQKPNRAISKSLQDVYWDAYEYELSKADLGDELATIAIDKIRDNKERGTSDGRYEFESVIDELETGFPAVNDRVSVSE